MAPVNPNMSNPDVLRLSCAQSFLGCEGRLDFHLSVFWQIWPPECFLLSANSNDDVPLTVQMIAFTKHTPCMSLWHLRQTDFKIEQELFDFLLLQFVFFLLENLTFFAQTKTFSIQDNPPQPLTAKATPPLCFASLSIWKHLQPRSLQLPLVYVLPRAQCVFQANAKCQNTNQFFIKSAAFQKWLH